MRSHSVSLATLALGALAACGSSSPVEVIVEPGITAIGESNALACDAELRTLEVAIESFTLLNADPPSVESDLVPGWLRSESQLYDLVDGHVVPAAGSGCPDPPADVTGSSADTTATDVLARMSDCTARFKTLLVAIEAYFAFNGMGTIPTEQALVDAGLLRGLDDTYDVDSRGLVVAVPGTLCEGVELLPDSSTTLPSGPITLPVDLGECEKQRKVLEVAMEAYSVENSAPALAETDLVPRWLLTEIISYDIVDGAIVPAPGSPCPAS